MKSALADATIVDLARMTGIPLADAEAASRIAAGASAAIEAVRSIGAGSESGSLFDYEPSDYLATLESLAEDTPGGSTAPAVTPA